MPNYQKEVNISKLRRVMLSMIAPALSKNARYRISTYLRTNKISINESSVITNSFTERLMATIFFIVSTVLFIASNTWGNAWVAIPFFTFLISFLISLPINWMIIPRGRETDYFKKGEIKPQYAREFKKIFPDSYSELSPRSQEIINDHIKRQETEKSLRKKIPFIILVYRNWTIILACIVIIFLIWGTILNTSKWN